MIVSTVVGLIALLISNGWHYDIGFFAKIFGGLQIQLFRENEYSTNYSIEFETRWLLLPCVVAFAFGLIKHLGLLNSSRDS